MNGRPLPPLLWLRIIKCYYLHPVRLLSHPLIKSAALRKLTTAYANLKREKIIMGSMWACGIACNQSCVCVCVLRSVTTSSFSLPAVHKCTVNTLCLHQWQFSRKLQVHFKFHNSEEWIFLQKCFAVVNKWKGADLGLVLNRHSCAFMQMLRSNKKSPIAGEKKNLINCFYPQCSFN